MKYFAYTAFIEPSKLEDVAPGAEFAFIAHLPEWGLGFPHRDGAWGGALPSAKPDPGSTIWGAVFELSDAEVKAVNKAEKKEGRTPSTVEVMDRAGRRHEVLTHLFNGNGKRSGRLKPSDKYLTHMLNGARHWQLPAGWIAGLEEHLER